MIYSYLFEAKSIQAYLFRTGKLKDVIAASERLDLLVDETQQSILYQVLETAGLRSDLHSDLHSDLRSDLHSDLIAKPKGEDVIRFTRCKSGVFYAFCQQQSPLVTLRSLWTLTVVQLFPNLTFADALTDAESISAALKAGQRKLAQQRHNPPITLPLASAVTARTARTGAVSIPLSICDPNETEIDPDTDFHRQAYRSLNMRSGAALQGKFTPSSLQGQIHYPINLEDDFQFSAPNAKADNKADNKEAIKDLAIIHLDGNGLGIVLKELDKALQNEPDDNYCHVLRQFSQALAHATANAAQQATDWLYKVGAYRHKAQDDTQKRTYLPMRPLVMGGDDVTLLCRADLALEYAKRFCIEFKHQSALALDKIYCAHLKNSKVKPYLTASGGVLFHKAGHPYTHSHRLVEDLTVAAKQLTKKVDPNVGPAALAFFRLSTAVSAQFSALRQQFQYFAVQDKANNNHIQLGYNAYLVEAGEHAAPCFAELAQCLLLGAKANMSIPKWRQMATHLALGNKTQADRIYERAIERCPDNKQVEKQQQAFKQLASHNDSNSHFHQWYWTTKPGQLQTIIADMLIVEHFTPVINAQTKEVCQ